MLGRTTSPPQVSPTRLTISSTAPTTEGVGGEPRRQAKQLRDSSLMPAKTHMPKKEGIRILSTLCGDGAQLSRPSVSCFSPGSLQECAARRWILVSQPAPLDKALVTHLVISVAKVSTHDPDYTSDNTKDEAKKIDPERDKVLLVLALLALGDDFSQV